MPLDLDAMHRKYATLAKYGMIAVVAAVSYPLAVMALEGLLVWLAVGVVTLIASNYAPAVGNYFANQKIAAIKAVAEANPIETMENLRIEKQHELDAAADNIRDFETELGNFKNEVAKVTKEFPEDTTEYQDAQHRMEDLLTEMQNEQTQATGELADFCKQKRKAEMFWNLAKSANKMLERSASAQNAVFADIKEKVSFDTVRATLNKSFANMNMVMAKRKNAALFAPKPVVKELPMSTGTLPLPNTTKVLDGELINRKR